MLISEPRNGEKLILVLGYGMCKVRKSLFSFTEYNKVSSFLEVFFVSIGGVGTRNDYCAVPFFSKTDHPECSLSHISEAHLGQVIEAVVIKDQEIRLMFIKQWNNILRRMRKHGIEEGNFVALFAHQSSCIQRANRGIRLTRGPLFGIKAHEIR